MIEKDKTYKTSDGKFIHIKEITRYNTQINKMKVDICTIVTGGICDFECDSKTNVTRRVWNYDNFMGLIGPEAKNRIIRDSDELIRMRLLKEKDLFTIYGIEKIYGNVIVNVEFTLNEAEIIYKYLEAHFENTRG